MCVYLNCVPLEQFETDKISSPPDKSTPRKKSAKHRRDYAKKFSLEGERHSSSAKGPNFFRTKAFRPYLNDFGKQFRICKLSGGVRGGGSVANAFKVKRFSKCFVTTDSQHFWKDVNQPFITRNLPLPVCYTFYYVQLIQKASCLKLLTEWTPLTLLT